MSNQGERERYFSIDLSQGEELWVASLPLPTIEPLLQRLSKAERQVIRLVLEDASNREIARRRGTSTNTVANQLKSAFAKLEIQCRAELFALMAGADPQSADPSNQRGGGGAR